MPQNGEEKSFSYCKSFSSSPEYFLLQNKIDLVYSQLGYGIRKAVFTLCCTGLPGLGATYRCARICLHLTPTHACVSGSVSPGLSGWWNSYRPSRFSLGHFSVMKSLPSLADQTYWEEWHLFPSHAHLRLQMLGLNVL